MTQYCNICCLSFDGEHCPICGRKSTRCVEPDDLCFLTEKDQIWSGMLADVLRQQNIPFIQKYVLGAGLSIKTGPMLERVRFYVFYKQLPEAMNVVSVMFSPINKENDDED